MTGDTTWLWENAWPVVASVAEFWVSRAVADDTGYHIRTVIPPDEYPEKGVNDSIYTNYAAKEALEFAVELTDLLGTSPDPRWSEVASGLVILYNETSQMHPEYAGYKWGQKIKQADVVLLPLALGMQMDPQVQLSDLEYYSKLTDIAGPAMTWGVHATGYLRAGKRDIAASNFDQSFANVRWPFYVWSETPFGGATNFITGAGGFLQTVIFGYTGVRIEKDYLEIGPTLPEDTKYAKLHGLHYHGSTITVSFDDQWTTVELDGGPPLELKDSMGKSLNLSKQVVIPAGEILRVIAPPNQPLKPSAAENAKLTWILAVCIGLAAAVVIFFCWGCMKSTPMVEGSDGEDDDDEDDD